MLELVTAYGTFSIVEEVVDGETQEKVLCTHRNPVSQVFTKYLSAEVYKLAFELIDAANKTLMFRKLENLLPRCKELDPVRRTLDFVYSSDQGKKGSFLRDHAWAIRFFITNPDPYTLEDMVFHRLAEHYFETNCEQAKLLGKWYIKQSLVIEAMEAVTKQRSVGGAYVLNNLLGLADKIVNQVNTQFTWAFDEERAKVWTHLTAVFVHYQTKPDEDVPLELTFNF